MTRSEQIEIQAKSLVEEFAKEQGIDPKEIQGLGMWFKLGCSWADKNPNGSQIKWQTGELKENGFYIVSYQFPNSSRANVTALVYTGKTWINGDWQEIDKNRIAAWCKLSDIEPYREKEETK